MWSLLPEMYVWIFAVGARHASARAITLAVLTTLWGVRLTFNFARKGGYAGVEDYRWAVVRARMSRGQFQLVNFFFIVLYQNALLVLIALPARDVTRATATGFGPLDVLLIIVFIALLGGETLADEQQWRFHQRKAHLAGSGEVATPGFLREGLFRYSRHPNYFFEIAQWWVVYLFAVRATGTLVHWSMLGAVLLTLLFVESTRFTERISAAKYRAYAQYQREVSAIIPWWPRSRPHDAVLAEPEPGWDSP
jgi:steroid 5-alpha reductase family enzyme